MLATIFKRSFQLLLAIFLLAGIFSFWVATSESGLRFALRQAEPLLKVDTVVGQLSDAQLLGVQLNLEGMRISISELELAWNPMSLLSKNLHLEKLVATNFEVDIEGATEKQSSEPWSGIELPIDIALQDFHLQSLRINPADGAPIVIEEVAGELHVSDNQLTLDSIKVRSVQADLDIDGAIGLAARAADIVELNIFAQTHLDQQNLNVDVSSKLDGTWQEIKFTSKAVATQAPFEENSKITLHQDTPGLTDKVGQLAINGFISGLLSPEPTLKLQGTWSIPFSLLREKSTLASNQYDGLSNSGAFEFSGLPDDYSFDLQGTTFDDVDALVNVQANGNGSLTQVSLDQLRVEAIQDNKIPITNFKGTGEADWSNGLKWVLDGELIDLEPVFLLGESVSDLGKLSGKISSQGQFSESAQNALGATGDLSASNVTATWQGLPMTADFKLNLSEKNIQLQNLAINGSFLAISAEGVVGDNSDLNWSLNASNLNSVSTQLGGALKAHGRVLGPITSPSIKFDLTGADITYLPEAGSADSMWKLGALSAKAEVSQFGQNAPLNLVLKADKLEQGGQLAAETLNLELSGAVQKHVLKASSTLSEQASFSASLSGGYAESSDVTQTSQGVWSGEINVLTMDSHRLAQWQLREPSRLQIDQGQVVLDTTCIVSEDQSLCAKANYSPSASRQNVSLNLNKFDLVIFEPFLKLQDIKLQGHVDGKLDFAIAGEDAAAKIEIELVGDSIRVGLPEFLDEGELDNVIAVNQVDNPPSTDIMPSVAGTMDREWLQFESAALTLSQTNSLQGKLNLKLDQDHFVAANLSSKEPLLVSNFQQVPIQGRIELKLADLSLLPSELIGGTQINGRLETQLDVEGTFSKPRVSMRSELSKANLFLPATGVTYSNISATAVSKSESKIDLKGRLRAGEGELNFDGEMDFSKLESPQAKLRLKGEKLSLLQSSDIDAVGGLDLQVSLEDQVTALTGDIVIERADLQLGARENVILASDDVVLQGSEDNVAQSKQRLRLNIDLGSATKLKAAGLSAELKGRLGISQEPGELMIGQGKIDVINGLYQAYGEELTISKGQLLFTGSSVDNPRLDLEATRDVASVVAGVRVQGTAQVPRLSLFSKPSMSDQDVLSMLIFGKKLSGLGGEDSLTLLKIAASLRGNGPDRFSRMTGQLQNALGLSELELRLAEDSPEIVAGKQLTSRFYVGYGYGLLDAAQSLVLRFKINDAWSVQGDFGANNGADLRYQIER